MIDDRNEYNDEEYEDLDEEYKKRYQHLNDIKGLKGTTDSFKNITKDLKNKLKGNYSFNICKNSKNIEHNSK